MQPWASHFRFPSLSFSICQVGIPSLQLMWLLWAWKEVREACGVCPGVDPKRPVRLPATGLALCPEGEGQSGVAGWTPHPPSRGRRATWHPDGALRAASVQSPGAQSCLQPGLTQPPGEGLQREGGEGSSHFKAKRKRSQQGILAQHTSLTLLPAKSSLSVVPAGDSLPVAETPRAPWLLSTGRLSSSLCSSHVRRPCCVSGGCAKFWRGTLPFMESQSLKRKHINQAKCQNVKNRQLDLDSCFLEETSRSQFSGFLQTRIRNVRLHLIHITNSKTQN